MKEKLFCLCLVGKKDPIAYFTAADLETAISQKYNSLNAISRDGNIISTPLLSYDIKESDLNIIKYYRYLREMDQYTLSKLSGISCDMLAHYEAGHLSLNKTRAITVYKLSQALGCEIEDLLN